MRHVSLIVPIAALFILCFGADQCAAQARHIRSNSDPANKRIIFVCDSDDLMIAKMPMLRAGLLEVIDQLEADHTFDIVFLRPKNPVVFGFEPTPATADMKKRCKTFLDNFKAGGDTDPMPAIKKAFEFKPDVIQLLCDHDFPDGDAFIKAIRAMNADHHVIVNTIAFATGDEKETAFMKVLRQVAEENDGWYKFVKVADLK